MNTEELAKELEEAVDGQTSDSTFAEQYPDAPEGAIKTAELIDALEKRVDRFEERVERKRASREVQLQALKNDLERKTAALAVHADVATAEEKQRVKSASKATDDGSSGLAQYFGPENEPDH